MMQTHQNMIQRVSEAHRLPDRGKELLARANQIFATDFSEINRFHEERKIDFANAFRDLLEAEIAHHHHVRPRVSCTRGGAVVAHRSHTDRVGRTVFGAGAGHLDPVERPGHPGPGQALGRSSLHTTATCTARMPAMWLAAPHRTSSFLYLSTTLLQFDARATFPSFFPPRPC